MLRASIPIPFPIPIDDGTLHMTGVAAAVGLMHRSARRGSEVYSGAWATARPPRGDGWGRCGAGALSTAANYLPSGAMAATPAIARHGGSIAFAGFRRWPLHTSCSAAALCMRSGSDEVTVFMEKTGTATCTVAATGSSLAVESPKEYAPSAACAVHDGGAPVGHRQQRCPARRPGGSAQEEACG